MAKKCMVERQRKRQVVVAKYASKRAELKAQVTDPKLGPEERQAAVVALQKLPRDTSPTRLRNRCQLTGRPRGYYRKFGLARNKLREAAVKGEIPGLTKASW